MRVTNIIWPHPILKTTLEFLDFHILLSILWEFYKNVLLHIILKVCWKNVPRYNSNVCMHRTDIINIAVH